jgi:hypothetical protein
MRRRDTDPELGDVAGRRVDDAGATTRLELVRSGIRRRDVDPEFRGDAAERVDGGAATRLELGRSGMRSRDADSDLGAGAVWRLDIIFFSGSFLTWAGGSPLRSGTEPFFPSPETGRDG